MTTKILLVDDFEPWRRSVRLILESNPSFRVISTGVNDNKSCLPHRAPIGEISTGIFASSNDESSIIMWSSSGQNWTDLEAMSILRYDPSLGVANGGDSVVLGDRLFLAVGDANGFVSFWSGDEYGTNLELYQTVDVRNPKPTNAWGLHNIRGISTMFSSGSAGYMASGSEDGYISVLSVPDGKVMSQNGFTIGHNVHPPHQSLSFGNRIDWRGSRFSSSRPVPSDSTARQRRSGTVVLTVMRVAAITPTMCATWVPEVS